MSQSSHSPRIVRKESPPKFRISHVSYRKYLERDFGDRCAYSGQRPSRAGRLEIDHHNPLLKGNARNNYENLFLATRHCNGKKGQRWPSADLLAQEIRFLNPCIELDYGHHIFEDPETFDLWGNTRAGKYHIAMLDLNHPTLVSERRQRAKYRKDILAAGIFSLTGSATAAKEALKDLRFEVEEMIPSWPQKSRPESPCV